MYSFKMITKLVWYKWKLTMKNGCYAVWLSNLNTETDKVQQFSVNSEVSDLIYSYIHLVFLCLF